MNKQEWKEKMGTAVKKVSNYKYPLLVLLIGVALMVVPTKKSETVVEAEPPPAQAQYDFSQKLEELLSQIHGAGRTKVLLTLACGPEVEYQVDREVQHAADGEKEKAVTVLRSTGSGSEDALITVTSYPIYRGAVVVCEGADSAAVRLCITQAVSSLTGLGSDKITVIKMNSN